jgi:hypothetical protein
MRLKMFFHQLYNIVIVEKNAFHLDNRLQSLEKRIAMPSGLPYHPRRSSLTV